MHYRRDIDGLRAIAVGSVVLYHAGVAGFVGGFVGVDVFFVVSGFLITSLIADDMRRGRFSIVEFYERRVRRIFPALFAMLLASSIAAALLLLPRDFSDFGQSLSASSLFVSNIFFWRTTEYFGGAAHLEPLLHTWSLAVEEQYYIAFPLMMVAIGRWLGGRPILWLLPLAAASFALAAWGTARHPVAAFYLAPARAWELLVGALLALEALPPLRNRVWREAAAAAGLGLIVWSVALIAPDASFPGVGALAPCIGAGLVIWAGMAGTTWIGRCLGASPVVFVGLISYSLYLWHWPLLSFARAVSSEPLEPVVIGPVLAAAGVVSVASWKLVEQPFRQKRLLPAPNMLFRVASVGTAGALAFGIVGPATKGWPERWANYQPPQIEGRERLEEGTCFLGAVQAVSEYAGAGVCRTGPERGPRVLLWGDSFAAHIAPGLARPDSRFSAHQLTASGCPPIIGHGAPRRPHCRAFNDMAHAVLATLEPDVVVLAARWEMYVGRSHDIPDIAATVDAIRALGADVLLVGQSPTFDFDSPYDFVFRHGRSTARVNFDVSLNARLAALAHVSFIDPMPVFCSGPVCALTKERDYLFFDGGHYSRTGSLQFANQLEPVIAAILDRRRAANRHAAQCCDAAPAH